MKDVYDNPLVSVERFANFLAFERRRHNKRMNIEAYHERMRFITADINPGNNCTNV